MLPAGRSVRVVRVSASRRGRDGGGEERAAGATHFAAVIMQGLQAANFAAGDDARYTSDKTRQPHPSPSTVSGVHGHLLRNSVSLPPSNRGVKSNQQIKKFIKTLKTNFWAM